MTDKQKPGVLLRYSSEHARDALSQWLEPDFRILPCASDEEAVAALSDPDQRLTALILLDLPPVDPEPHRLLVRARDQHPGLLKILIGDSIGLHTLTALLDEGLVDRCFEHPVDPDLLRSHLLTAALLRHERTSNDHQTDQPQGAPPAVLIVDDETTATKYLSRRLNRMQTSFRVLCADSAEQALKLIEDRHNGIAVVMTDQRMPGLQGKELLDQLKLSRPDIVRILTSAYGEVGVALDAVNEGGIFRYQTKPWQADRLLPVFHEALDQHQAIEEAQRSRASETTQTFRSIVGQRVEALQSTLGPLVDELAGGPATRDFLDTLSAIETLPPNGSHLRASQETPLERRLVTDIKDSTERATAGLSAGQEVPQWPDTARFEDLWRQTAGISEEPDNEAPMNATDLLLRSLATLFRASGLHPDALHIHTGIPGQRITLTTAEPLRIYTHLLAPLTRLSTPLLDQQCALLMTHLATRKLSGELTVRGSRQSCYLTITLPVRSATGEHQ